MIKTWFAVYSLWLVSTNIHFISEQILRQEQKPLFGSLSSRQSDCLSSVIKFAAVCGQIMNSDLVKQHCLKVLSCKFLLLFQREKHKYILQFFFLFTRFVQKDHHVRYYLFASIIVVLTILELICFFSAKYSTLRS